MAHLPADAFERYVALGAGRTYEALARALGVSKRTVVRRATAEGWQERLAHVERQGLAKAEARLSETAAAITERHLRVLRAIQGRALQALTTAPTGTAAQASATLIAAVRAERAIVSPPETQGIGVVWREILDDVSRRAPVPRREAPPVLPATPAPLGAPGET